MYRLVLDYYNVFDKFHFRQYKDAKDNTYTNTNNNNNDDDNNNDNNIRLHCYDVWSISDLPWQSSLALKSDCIFSGILLLSLLLISLLSPSSSSSSLLLLLLSLLLLLIIY